MSIQSNIDKFCKKLEYLSDVVRTDEGLGEEIARVIGDRNVERAALEIAPDGTHWADNDPAYAERKGGLPVGVLTGDMLSDDNMRGRVTIGDRSVSVAYGGSEFARAKLGWFAAGGRVAWGMDAAMVEGIRAALRDHVRSRLRGR
jgi:hypothetical protein